MKKTAIWLSVSYLFLSTCFSQNMPVADTSTSLKAHIDSLVKATCGPDYQANVILDVDDRTAQASYRVYQDFGCIFEDPRHQLEHSFIVAVGKYEGDRQTLCDSGSIALVREDKVIWFSKPLIHNFGYPPLPGFGDLNNDGTTDILLTTPIDMRGYGEALWILSPDSSGGRLLNQVDEYNQSTIVGASSTFHITQPKGSRTKVIEAHDLDSEKDTKLIYAWNGLFFVRQTSGKPKTR